LAGWSSVCQRDRRRVARAFMDRYLRFNDEFSIAACTTCKSGVEGDIARHFARHHSET
jgi:hypothetical protein